MSQRFDDAARSGKTIGRSLPRLEDEPLLLGKGRFADDISFPNQLHMRMVRSQHAHGRIVGAEVAAACAQAEGVTIDENMLKRYGPTLHPSQIGRQVAELLVEPRYETGTAYGFRADIDIMPLDQ